MFIDPGNIDPDDPSIPEFMREGLREAQAQARIAATERDITSHDRSRVWNSFDEEQLVLLRNLLSGIANNEEPAMIAGYLNGYTVALLETRHNICPIHQVDHDKELLGAAHGGLPDEASEFFTRLDEPETDA